MIVDIPMHSVVTLVGPTESGKTTLTSVLIQQLRTKYPLLSFHTLSSDSIRRELIGDVEEELSRDCDEMLFASEAAFEVLYCKLRALLSFPLSLKNAVVFIDTTGLSEVFRTAINKIANEYNYNKVALVMEFKERNDFFLLGNESSKETKAKQVKRLMREAMPKIKRRTYNGGVIKVREITPNWSGIEVKVRDYHTYMNHWLPTKNLEGELIEYTILPDTHGCFDEVIEVLNKAGFDIKDGLVKGPSYKRIVCLSDYMDKGSKVRELLRFLYTNKDYIHFCKGNHEDFIVRYFSKEGESNLDYPEYFDSIEWLKDTEELDMLRDLHNRSHTFLIHPNFLCTHSPCETRYLGKLDVYSEKNQVRSRYPYGNEYASAEEYKTALEKSLAFMKSNIFTNQPFVFSGHIPLNRTGRVGNRVLLDTGVVHGNCLTVCRVTHNRKLEFSYVYAKENYNPTKFLVDVFDAKPNVDIKSLEPNEQSRVKACLGDKPSLWFAPTMPPSPSSEDSLEPLHTALEYYLKEGVTDLVMQCKFMGSNGVFVWKPEPEDCYMTSRNGFLVDHVDISPIVNKFHPLIQERFPDAHLVALSGEIMPWSVLGQGLIEHHFNPIHKGMESELQFSIENGFDECVSNLLSMAKGSFFEDRKSMPKKGLREKYGDARTEWYDNILDFSKYLHPSNVLLEEVSRYKSELETYTQAGNIEFEPFQVLKVERLMEDGDVGVEVLPFDNQEGFNMFNTTPLLRLDLTQDLKSTYKLAERVFKDWLSAPQSVTKYAGLEGVVIKPLDPHLKNVLPYMKVRNPEYLKLIYGPTYNLEPQYGKLLKTKNISGKVKTCISEWKLGLELLSFPSNEMSVSNQKVLNTLIKFIGEEKKVETLDPRL